MRSIAGAKQKCVPQGEESEEHRAALKQKVEVSGLKVTLQQTAVPGTGKKVGR